VETDLNTTLNSQKAAFKLKFAAGLLNPLSSLNVSVRLGQLSLNILSRWSIKPVPPKPESGVHYLTIAGRIHWLMLRESMFSLYWSWKNLPTIIVVSDGSWSAEDFYSVFSWWPGKINVLSREQIIAQADAAGERELAQYAEASPYGLKLASIVLLARREPVLFVDADILWFKDPTDLFGSSDFWAKPRGVSESNCHQHRDMALRYCPKVLEPPFVNGGILALHGEFLTPEILRAMVHEALADPKEGAFEQTIIASAVHRGAGLLPNKVSLVAFDDIHKFCRRNMRKEGYYSRHYVSWMRHLLYRDALRLRWRAVLARNYVPSG
jgi:nucleotide-diphospho-sugar transferase